MNTAVVPVAMLQPCLRCALNPGSEETRLFLNALGPPDAHGRADYVACGNARAFGAESDCKASFHTMEFASAPFICEHEEEACRSRVSENAASERRR